MPQFEIGEPQKGFSNDFIWGTNSSSTQVEGAAPQGDWFDWEAQGNAPRSGDGNGFKTRYAEDFSLYASFGLSRHRLSIDWARIEPSEGRRDGAEIEHAAADEGATIVDANDDALAASRIGDLHLGAEGQALVGCRQLGRVHTFAGSGLRMQGVPGGTTAGRLRICTVRRESTECSNSCSGENRASVDRQVLRP